MNAKLIIPDAFSTQNREAFLPNDDGNSDKHWGLAEVVSGLRQSREHTKKIRYQGRVRELPSREVMQQILDGLAAALFPTHYGRPDLNDESIDHFVGSTLHACLTQLAEQIRRSLLFSAERSKTFDHNLKQIADGITQSFASQLPDIRAFLVGDLYAAQQGDPAANSISEILLCYPGFRAILSYRLAHTLYLLGAPFLARIISNLAYATTGIDIHPGARIGSEFFIDHGSGVVIGETSIIGERVRIYQAVTLGSKSFPADENGHLIKGNARHPIVEDDVVIYAGATILGRITIGKGSVIGGNVWLTQSVPAHSHISQASNRNS
ncbi:serine acetyltransferase [Chitinibacter fontanus]|uniref:Serine acetyltransferase n=1 Tax=Chitinibacter fontanus TaxID=1737446 RepID=A0A7D5ZB83_9NEIS|nr:serine O-acetyltransferase EpsC [Chitinibacter fontanus]QLI83002.1 serine acetyltransferase [Chitinibacter fontanus]